MFGVWVLGLRVIDPGFRDQGLRLGRGVYNLRAEV